MADGGWPVEYDRVFRYLRLLGPIMPRKGWWEACCPVHGDRRQSLSLKVGRRCLLVRCHAPAHCPVDRIMNALGLPMQALFPDGTQAEIGGDKEPPKFVCAYDYRDESKRLLFQVVRWLRPDGSKTFSQRRPNPHFNPTAPRDRDKNPEWLSGVQGVRLVPYRLPELLESLAAKPDRVVFIVEGEKAVDYCRAAGLTATTNPMGAGTAAGKWRTSYSELLAGRNVAVVPDEDPFNEELKCHPGLAHAGIVCLSLFGLAASIRLVRLPEMQAKWGLDDWLEAQKQRVKGRQLLAELNAVVKATPEWAPAPTDIIPEAALLSAEMHRAAADGGCAPVSLQHLFGMLRHRSAYTEAGVMEAAEKGLTPDRKRALLKNLRRLAASSLAGLRYLEGCP